MKSSVVVIAEILVVLVFAVNLKILPLSASTEGSREILSISYSLYVEVRKCWEGRQGSATIFISDPQMERAKYIVRRIEETVKRNDSALDTNTVWRNASIKAESFNDARSCKARYDFLLNEYRKLLPEENVTSKDF